MKKKKKNNDFGVFSFASKARMLFFSHVLKVRTTVYNIVTRCIYIIHYIICLLKFTQCSLVQYYTLCSYILLHVFSLCIYSIYMSIML